MKTWMETTDHSTFVNYSRWGTWIKHRKERNVTNDATWVFSDGSSSGWYGATILVPGDKIIEVAKFEETPNRNINPEINAAILGLSRVEDGRTVNLVHDLFGIAPWYLGHWNMTKDAVKEKITRLRDVVASKGLDLNFIHHGGHQDKKKKGKAPDPSDFTRWNCNSDRLCSGKTEVDKTDVWPWWEHIIGSSVEKLAEIEKRWEQGSINQWEYDSARTFLGVKINNEA